MYKLEIACIEGTVRGILITEDGEVLHDIYRVRTERELFLMDNCNVIIELTKVPKQLKRVRSNEKYLSNKDRVKIVKYNNSGSITISYYKKDMTYDSSKGTIYTVHKIQKKNRSSSLNVDSYGTGNVALDSLIKDIEHVIGEHNANFGLSNLLAISNNKETGDSHIIVSITDKSLYSKIYKEILMPAVESLAIFL